MNNKKSHIGTPNCDQTFQWYGNLFVGMGEIKAGWLDSRSVSNAIWWARTHLECNATRQQRAPGRQDTHRCTWESVCWFVEQEDTCSYSRHFHLSLHTSWYLFTLKINIKAATAIKHLNSFINISATEPLHWKRGSGAQKILPESWMSSW